MPVEGAEPVWPSSVGVWRHIIGSFSYLFSHSANGYYENSNGNVKIGQKQKMCIHKPLIPPLLISTCYVGTKQNTFHGCSYLVLYRPASRLGLERLRSWPKVKQARGVTVGFERGLPV